MKFRQAAIFLIFFFGICQAKVSDDGKHKSELENKQDIKTTGYKIMAFLPFPSKSHHRVVHPLLKELAARGHHVTIVTPLPTDESIPNYRQIVINNYEQQIMRDFQKNAGTSDFREMLKMKWMVHYMFLFMIRIMGTSMASMIFTDPAVQDLLKSDEKYDAIIFESSFSQEMNIALAHKFNAVSIEVLTAGNFHWSYWLFGNPYDTSYIADMTVPYSDQMTFIQRIHNTINSLLIRGVYRLYYMPIYQDVMDQYIRYPGWETRPSMMDMLRNVSLVLVNTHVSLNYAFPMAPHFKEVGGINIVPHNKLSKELQEFMDGAKDGVVYFSLGSNANATMVFDNDTVEGLVRLFGTIKQRVLWKYDQPTIPGLSSNVKISTWFPQQDILAHKNCKVFITHAGFLSLSESIHHAVPMIATPLAADQMRNAKHIDVNSYGIVIDFFNITEQSFNWALTQILNDPKYKDNVKRQSELFRDKPETALETGVYWTEYVIRHRGAHHLKPAVISMPYYQQAMIDVYAALAAIMMTPVAILYFSIKLMLRLICHCCSSSNKSQEKKSKSKKE